MVDNVLNPVKYFIEPACLFNRTLNSLEVALEDVHEVHGPAEPIRLWYN